MALNLDPISVPWRRVCGFACCLAWFTALAWWHRGVAMDDPWITFRYAANVLAGRGWAFNAGDPLEGYSNFTWVLASAAAIWANVEPLGAMRLLGWLCGATLLWALCMGWRVVGAPRSVAAGLMLAASYPLAVWSMGGLETVFHALLVYMYIIALTRSWDRESAAWGAAAGAILALVAMTRVEGAMFAAVAVGAGMFGIVGSSSARTTANQGSLGVSPARLSTDYPAGFQGPVTSSISDREPNPARARRPRYLGSAVALGVFAVIFGVYTVWRYHAFGVIVANTVKAKSGSSLDAGVWYFVSYFSGAPALLLVLAGIALWRIRRQIRNLDAPARLAIVAAMAVGLQLAFAVAVGGDWMPAARFIVPALAPLCLLAAWGMAPWPTMVRGGLVAGVLLGGLFAARQEPMLRWCRWAAKEEGGLIVEPLREAGQWLRDNAPPDAVLAGTEAGVIPYYSKLEFIDMLGLVDRHIAALPGGLHQKFDGAYVIGRRPDFVVLQFTETPQGEKPTWAPDLSLFQQPDFHGLYREVAAFPRPVPDTSTGRRWGMTAGWLRIYRRVGGASDG